MIRRNSKVKLVAVAALATGALAVPLAGQASAQTPTKLVAHSIVADINDVNVQANVPLRPSATLTVRGTGQPVVGRFVQFFAAGQGLCAEKTNNLGYAECKGIVRVLYPTLALGRYTAVFPGDATYAKSTDTGQILTIGSATIF